SALCDAGISRGALRESVVATVAARLRPVFGIKETAAVYAPGGHTSGAEFLGVLALGEAEDGHVHVVVTVAVATRAQRQSLAMAEEMDRQANCCLSTGMRAGPLDAATADLSLPCSTRPCGRPREASAGRRPRSRDAPGEGQGRVRSGGWHWISVA